MTIDPYSIKPHDYNCSAVDTIQKPTDALFIDSHAIIVLG